MSQGTFWLSMEDGPQALYETGNDFRCSMDGQPDFSPPALSRKGRKSHGDRE
jgi:hypothetical protein